MSNPSTTDNGATGAQNNPNTTVTIAAVSTTDNDAVYETPLDSSDPSVYNHTQIINRYENRKHRYMLGITSPTGFQGQSAAFVQLAAPTLLWISSWTVLRSASKPKIPDPDAGGDPNWVLLFKEYSLPMMVPTPADGQRPVYRINGVYVYGRKNPQEETLLDVSWPRPPWADNVFSRLPNEDMFDDTLITALE